jgi:hypothetical protein
MRQCQTKSFLGNLVCFKTCNHDLRNSLKLMGTAKFFPLNPLKYGFKNGETPKTYHIIALADCAYISHFMGLYHSPVDLDVEKRSATLACFCLLLFCVRLYTFGCSIGRNNACDAATPRKLAHDGACQTQRTRRSFTWGVFEPPQTRKLVWLSQRRPTWTEKNNFHHTAQLQAQKALPRCQELNPNQK